MYLSLLERVGALCRYLLKLMTGDRLPASEAQFSEQLKLYFPKVWDMKYIMGKKNIHGGLSKVCMVCVTAHAHPSRWHYICS